MIVDRPSSIGHRPESRPSTVARRSTLDDREFTPLPSPEEALAYQYSPQERVIVEANRQRHFIGTPFNVAGTIRNLVSDTGADEIMVTSMMYGRDARFRAYELLANEWGLPSDQDSSIR